MAKDLKKINHNESDYFRTNGKWVCGNTGNPCPVGPDNKGNCKTIGECIPSKDGDRWVCQRLPWKGGTCEQGPSPEGNCACLVKGCQPKRNLRSFRGSIVLLVALVTLGFLMFFAGGESSKEFFNPGELSDPHSMLLVQKDGDTSTNCAACHVKWGEDNFKLPEGHMDLGSWTHSDSGRCIRCHEMGEQPFHAHGLSDAKLNEVKQSAGSHPVSKDVMLKAAKSAGFGVDDDGFACAICHSEHQGADHSLVSIDNNHCQVCHTRVFEDFANGHPDFNITAEFEEGVFFNHSNHLKKHFPSNGITMLDCAKCHKTTVDQKAIEFVGYEKACADCHDKGFKNASPIKLIQVPAIDAKKVGVDNEVFNGWPKYIDGKITVFMQNALVGKNIYLFWQNAKRAQPNIINILRDDRDEELLDNLKAIGLMDSIDSFRVTNSPKEVVRLLKDLDATEYWNEVLKANGKPKAGFKIAPENYALIIRAAKSMEKLMKDLSADGLQLLHVRLHLHSSFPMKAGMMPVNLVRELDSSNWLKPKIAKKIVEDLQGSVGDDSGELVLGEESDGELVLGDEDTGELSLGEDEDELSLGDDTEELQLGGSDEEELTLGDSDDGELTLGDEGDGELVLGEDESDGELILGDDSEELVLEDSDSGEFTLGDEDSEELVLGEDSESEEFTFSDDSSNSDATKENASEVAKDHYKPEAKHHWMKGKGNKNSVYGFADSHADVLMTGWLDYAAEVASSKSDFYRSILDNPNPEMKVLNKSPGKCLKCHKVEEHGDGTVSVNWNVRLIEKTSIGFNKFSHAPHLRIGTTAHDTCQQCHQIKGESSEGLGSFKISGFDQIPKQTCTQCHNNEHGSNRCLTCHNYHVGKMSLIRLSEQETK